MAKKAVHKAGGKPVAPQPSAGREIVIRPVHLLIGVLTVLALVLGLVLLTRLFEPEPQTAVAPLPGSAPIQVQPGSAPIQIQPGGGQVAVPAGQVVYPSGANRTDSTPEGFPAEGRADAPVTALIFSDFQCPYCRQFAQDILPGLREKWINTGKLRIIWRDMAIRGAESEAAGAAALCAHEQGRFWAYHDLLFARQQGQNEGAFSATALKALAPEAGRIQPEIFNQCVDSARYLPAVKASTQDATGTLKLTGTPTFFINGQKTEGNLEPAKWDELLTIATQ
jgi:protein-disulfide isomerase